MGSRASNKAADTAAQSASEATAAQQAQFDKQVELQEPFRQSGLAANNRLAYLLGLPGATAPGAPGGVFTGQASASSFSAPTTYVNGQTDDPVWEKILGDFNTSHQARFGTAMNRDWNSDGDAQRQYKQLSDLYRQAKMSEAHAQAPAQTQQGQPAQAANDPAAGSLLKTFTADDLNADPVYQSGLQFGLSEGEKGINRQAAATGSSLSGATLKALTRFGNDYGSTKANDAFNRFNVNQDRTYNKLAGVSGAGQQATNQVGQAAQNFGTAQAGNITSAGNARAAGYIGQANAVSNGVGQGVNAWQSNSLMNRVFPTGMSSTAPIASSSTYEPWQTTGSGMPSSYQG